MTGSKASSTRPHSPTDSSPRPGSPLNPNPRIPQPFNLCTLTASSARLAGHWRTPISRTSEEATAPEATIVVSRDSLAIVLTAAETYISHHGSGSPSTDLV